MLYYIDEKKMKKGGWEMQNLQKYQKNSVFLHVFSYFLHFFSKNYN